MLRSQLDILDEPDSNPFQCDEFTSSDVEEAYPILIFCKFVNSVKT